MRRPAVSPTQRTIYITWNIPMTWIFLGLGETPEGPAGVAAVVLAGP